MPDGSGLTIIRDRSFWSLKATEIIAQGKAEGRNPGCRAPKRWDPEGVVQTSPLFDPFRVGRLFHPVPGVTLALLAHPRLFSSSPSATIGSTRTASCWGSSRTWIDVYVPL